MTTFFILQAAACLTAGTPAEVYGPVLTEDQERQIIHQNEFRYDTSKYEPDETIVLVLDRGITIGRQRAPRVPSIHSTNERRELSLFGISIKRTF